MSETSFFVTVFWNGIYVINFINFSILNFLYLCACAVHILKFQGSVYLESKDAYIPYINDWRISKCSVVLNIDTTYFDKHLFGHFKKKILKDEDGKYTFYLKIL